MTVAAISCLIRTLNEEELLGTCITKIREQGKTLGIDVEFVVVDSGSVDDTVKIAQEQGCTLLHIQGSSLKDFNYSDSLNKGMAACSGELVISISAHAIPVSDDWLSVMIASMESPNTAGSYCRQIPWPKSNWHERLRLAKQFPDDSLQPANPFSNAASMIRKSNWEKQPFVLPSGEDWHWAQLMTESGYDIKYVPETSVYHSHFESPRAQAQRLVSLENSENDYLQKRQSLLYRVTTSFIILTRDTIAIMKHEVGITNRGRSLIESASKAFWYLVESR